MNLDLHAKAQGGVSAFRGTTENMINPGGMSGAGAWAGDGGYVFVIIDTKGWSVNQIFPGNPMVGEQEIAILAHVPNYKIKGVQKIKQVGNQYKTDGPFIPNPNFRP